MRLRRNGAARPIEPDEAAPPPSADACGLRGCHACGLVFERLDDEDDVRCPRCGTVSHHRHRASLQRTWAWLLTAMLAYAPANLYPVFSSTSFGSEEGHTIIGGVVELISAGSWDLALVVFVASVIVPVLKMLALTVLAIRAGRRSPSRASRRLQATRSRTYRIVDAIGHWSMLDIFVVALLVALAQFDQLMTVRPEPGAFAFAIVVITTMMASEAFDPRLLWDRHVNPDDAPIRDPAGGAGRAGEAGGAGGAGGEPRKGQGKSIHEDANAAAGMGRTDIGTSETA